MAHLDTSIITSETQSQQPATCLSQLDEQAEQQSLSAGQMSEIVAVLFPSGSCLLTTAQLAMLAGIVESVVQFATYSSSLSSKTTATEAL